MKGIKKKDLVEIRSLANPPPAVKLALEAICLLLGESGSKGEPEWKVIRQTIIKESFIASMVNMKTDDIS